jgi:hypothetical protein
VGRTVIVIAYTYRQIDNAMERFYDIRAFEKIVGPFKFSCRETICVGFRSH